MSCTVQQLEWSRRYREKNRDKCAAAVMAWAVRSEENRERRRVAARAWKKCNADKITAYRAEHWQRQKLQEYGNYRAWCMAHPDQKRVLDARRRARKIGNGGSHTVEQRLETFARLGNVCIYCGKSRFLTIDHDLPLSHGGTDDISNILPACKSCNSRKGARTAKEFVTVISGAKDINEV